MSDVCRYRVSVEMPSPDDYLYDAATALFTLEVTSPHLPRVGEELSFDALDGLDLDLTVTEVIHTFRHAKSSRSQTLTTVVAEPLPYKVAAAHRLLVDPELLTRWAEQLPDVEVVPIPWLVTVAAEYRQRHPQVDSARA